MYAWPDICISGVPKLKRPELETACEDFSNVIGSSSIGTVYKGTLSSGVEIAVTSAAVTSSKDWSKNLEVQFRKKVLERLHPLNFVVLIHLGSPYSFFGCGFRSKGYQKWTTRILSTFSDIVKKRNLSPEWWFLNMLRMERFLSIYIVSIKFFFLSFS